MPLFTGSIQTHPSYKPLLGSFKVRLRFLRQVEGERLPIEQSASVESDASYRLDVDDDARADTASSISVLGPTSETLAGALLADLLEDATKLKPIKVTGTAPSIPLNPLPPNVTTPLRRLTIRVFVANSGILTGHAAARLYVQIFGKLKRLADTGPLSSGVTNAAGYLSLILPNEPFDKVIARIGAATPSTDTEIALSPEGLPPDRVILTVPAASAEEDCHCDLAPPRLPDRTELAENGDIYSTDLGAGCEDFTVPNRTLEEFDFFKIVRTTDPDIKGLTMPDTLSSGFVNRQVLKLAFDSATLSQELRTVDLAVPSPRGQIGMGNNAGTLDARPPDRMSASTSRAAMTARGLNPTQPAAELASSNARSLQDLLPSYVDVRPLEAAGTVTAGQWRESTEEAIVEASLKSTLDKIPARALRAALADPDGFTPVSLMTLERRASIEAFRAYLNARRKIEPGRGELTEENPPDWDETAEFYQATSIAHGHLLHFKQEWKADGYSLGELVKSIPLAPGQRKQIAVLDWDREDLASRTESRDASESLEAFISRDRDINEIANASFRESIKGGSQAKTGAVAGGIGFAIGPLVIGGGGGSAWSSSTAWNDGSRDLTGQTLNELREEISQGVSAVRNQRSTVIETVGQRERVTATTEVIANHNRCHAMTVQYFEVLRHFAVQERLAGVQECLYVPLQMTLFDDPKVLRWRDILTEACRKAAVRGGFESIWRLSSPATTPPDRAFADDPVEEMSGRVFLRVSIARPKDPDDASRAVLEQTEWRFFGIILRVNPEVVYEQYRRNEQKRDQIFRTEIAPEIARQFLESLSVMLIDRDGNEHDAGLDLTLLSRYTEGGVMEIALNERGAGPRLTRREIAGVEIRTSYQLPEFSRVIVERAALNYRTERFTHSLYRNDRVLDDILAGDAAFLSTSALTRAEERNQLKEDRERRRKLLRHLNDSIEYYHRAIWWRMDAARRFMLLDGFEAPQSGGRSVASVVENRLIGIVGNALVMPVAPGFQLDPALRQVLKRNEDPLDALKTLYDMAPSLARRHSVPTKGVFAEAMNGKCNSCEMIEEDRFWRWKEFPLPDSPPPISGLSTDSRFAAGADLTPSGFPDALVKFQTVPTAPAPTGMAAALNLLGKDVFKDLTGLTANQKNAMAALTTAFGTSEAFAGEAFKLALAQDAARNVDRTIDQIQQAKEAGLLSDEEASKATRDALLRSLGEDGTQSKDVTELSGVKEALDQLGKASAGSASITRGSGENAEAVEVKKEDGSALTIGTPAPVTLRALPVIETQTALIEDTLIPDPLLPGRFKHTRIRDSRDITGARKRMLQEIPGKPDELLDLFRSAVGMGFINVSGSTFTLNVNTRVGFPANQGDTSKIADPVVVGTKYPLVILLHGNAPAWFQRPGSTATNIDGETVTNGVSVFKVMIAPLDSQPNHAGYDYLQRWLAEDGRGMVSVSIETNVANSLDLLVDMRAQIVVDVLEKLHAQSKKPDSIFSKVDFQNIGLMGHSRGGEAVLRVEKMLRGSAKFKVRAVCSLAPTDVLGASNNAALSIPKSANTAYLVVYGGLDFDMSGARTAGDLEFGGVGFRQYDRSTAHKAMAFIPFCCHTRFNTVWTAFGLQRAADAGFPGEQAEDTNLLPAHTFSRPMHEALAKEYVGGFFDLVLNRDFGLRDLFDNSLQNAPGKPVAIQWSFGSLIETLDEFDGPNASATLPAGSTRTRLAPLVTPAGTTTGSRNRHVPHDTNALVIDVAAVGAPTARVVYALAPAGGVKDLNHFDAITFRLGILYPVTDQAAIDATPDPSFTVSITDKSGVTESLTSTEMFADMANGWTKPAFKIDDGVNATQMFLQTVPFNLASLLLKSFEQPQPGVNLAEAVTLTLELDTSAGAGEIWLDSVMLTKV